jgi:hypothetical protein
MLRLRNNNERENYHEPLSFLIIPTFDVFTKAQDKSMHDKIVIVLPVELPGEGALAYFN